MKASVGGSPQQPKLTKAQRAEAKTQRAEANRKESLEWAAKQWGVRDPAHLAEQYVKLGEALWAFEEAMSEVNGFSTPLLAASIVRYFGGAHGPDALFYTDFLVAARKHDLAKVEADRHAGRSYVLPPQPAWAAATAERFDVSAWKRGLFRDDAMALHQAITWFVSDWSEGTAKAVVREALGGEAA